MRARKTSAWQISGLLILQPADDGGDVFCIDAGIAHHEHGVVASERARDALELGRVKTASFEAEVKAAVEEGCKAENAFRGVKAGEVRNGVASDIRWSVK